MKSCKALLQNSALVIISLCIILGVCEYVLEIYPVQFSVDTGRDDEPRADKYVASMAVPEGVNREWFRQSPIQGDQEEPEFSSEAVQLYKRYLDHGLYAPQSYYIWNKIFVDQHVCITNDYVFGRYGDLASTIKVFVPSNDEPYPRYRFPPNASTPGGLRTNRYGFRGSDFEPIKQPDTIRIAFLGASTTVANHNFPFSYPDHFGYWINLWLKANDLPLRVEIINAGREGIGSTDIAAVLRDEVLPLTPDYVIYYEGANQIGVTPQLLRPPMAVPPYPRKNLLPSQLVRHSNVAKIIEQFYATRFFPLIRQWRRPPVDLAFPEAINEVQPDIQRPDLPLNLTTILADLRYMADLTEQSGGRFLVSSFIWLNGSELGGELNDARLREVLSNVDRVFWPLSSPDVRRLVDFQNRVLERFAEQRQLGFLDIARAFPRDLHLFTDAIHFTEEGVRLQAWIAMTRFVPYLIGDLKKGFPWKSRVPRSSNPMKFLPTVGKPYDLKCSSKLMAVSTAGS